MIEKFACARGFSLSEFLDLNHTSNPNILGSGSIKLNETPDDDFEPDLNQPVGCLPVLTAN